MVVTILPVVSPEVLLDPAIFQKVAEHGSCLISYSHYVRDSKLALRMYCKLANAKVRVVLDSGAFEVNSGHIPPIDIDDYGRFLQKWATDTSKFKLFETYINLDKLFEPLESKGNFMYLRHQYNLSPMQVFHYEKTLSKKDQNYWKEFEDCLETPDANGVVGLGGAVHQQSKLA